MKKPEKWTQYAFVDHKENETIEIWHHPTLGYIDMYINGKLVGKPKGNPIGLQGVETDGLR